MKDWFVPILLAVILCGGLLYVLVIGLSPSPTLVPAPAPSAATASKPHSTPEDLSATLPGGISTPTPADIAALRARCVEESRSGNGLTLNLASACQQFAEASRLSLPTPRALPPAPRLPQTSPAPRLPSDPQHSGGLRYAPVYVEQCGRYGKGSIEYRRCRSREAERLRKECLRYPQLADRANGEERQRLRDFARAYCRESNRYRVID